MAHEEHESAVAGGPIEGAKGQNIEGEKEAVGPGKAEFFAVRVADFDLVESGFGVDADPEEAACSRGEVVNSLIAAGNRETVAEGDLVEAAVVDTKAPDKI